MASTIGVNRFQARISRRALTENLLRAYRVNQKAQRRLRVGYLKLTIRQTPVGRPTSFLPPDFVPATRAPRRGSAQRFARRDRRRRDRTSLCNNRPGWAGPEEPVADHRRREAWACSGRTRWNRR